MFPISSNSILIAFDGIGFNGSPTTYKYLDGIQNLNINFNSNYKNKNFIGDLSEKYLFTNPEVDLQISYFQSPSLLNEGIFGLNTNSIVNGGVSSLGEIFKEFKNKNAIIVFDDNYFSDLALKIIANNFSTDLILFNLGNLFLKSYSLSYSAKTLPLVEASFVASRLKVVNPIYENSKYHFIDNDLQKIDLTLHKEEILNRFNLTNSNIKRGDFTTLSIRDFSILTDIQNIDVPSLNKITSFENSIITALKFNFDIPRYNEYEISTDANFSKNECINRIVNSSVDARLNISGISSSFSKADIDSFVKSINQYKNFYFSIRINDKETASFDAKRNNAVIHFSKIKIDAFSYDIGIDNKLIYEISCSFKINENDGFFMSSYIPIGDLDATVFLTQDDNILISKDGLVLTPYEL
jgi:hypothetical protein